MTRDIIDIATPAAGFPVRDHIIVGRNGHASLKGMRLTQTNPDGRSNPLETLQLTNLFV